MRPDNRATPWRSSLGALRVLAFIQSPVRVSAAPRGDFSHATFRALKLQSAKFVDRKFDGAVIRNCFVFNWRYEGGAHATA